MKRISAILGRVLIALAPITVLVATVYTLMLPNLYSSSVLIGIAEDAPEIHPFYGKEQYSAYTGSFLRAQYEVVLSNPILYEVINRLNLELESARDVEMLPREVALKNLKSSIQVFEGRNISLMYIKVTRDNPDEAAEIVNEIAEIYRNFRLDALREQEAMKEQVKRVEAAEEKVEQLREELDATIVGRVDADELKLLQLETDSIQAVIEVMEKEGLLNNIQGYDIKNVQELASYITLDQTVRNIIRQAQDVSTRLNVLMAELGSSHMDVKRLARQEEVLKEALEEHLLVMRNRVQTEYQLAQKKYESLEMATAEMYSKIIEYPSKQYQLFRAAIYDVKTERSIYNDLEEPITLSKTSRNPVKIINAAEPNFQPVGPNRFLNISVSVLIAGFFGLAGAVLLKKSTAWT